MYTKLYNYINDARAFLNGREYDGDTGAYGFICCHVTGIKWIFEETSRDFHAERSGAILELNVKGPGRAWIEINEDGAKIYGFFFDEGSGRGYCMDIPGDISGALWEELNEYYSFVYIED